MSASGYDPHAAARVWRMIIEEEERAVVKREEPNIFTMTHPSSEDRVVELEAYVSANLGGSKRNSPAPNRHVEILKHLLISI